MSRSLQQPLPPMELRNPTPARQGSESPRRNVTADGALVEHAMKVAQIEAKQLADAMGVSASFLLRGFKDIEQISWQRLLRACAEYPRFKLALLEVLAVDTAGVEVVTSIRIQRTA